MHTQKYVLEKNRYPKNYLVGLFILNYIYIYIYVCVCVCEHKNVCIPIQISGKEHKIDIYIYKHTYT